MLKSQMKGKSTPLSSWKTNTVGELGLKKEAGLSRHRKECIQGRERWVSRQKTGKGGLGQCACQGDQVQAEEVLLGLPTGHSCPVSSEHFLLTSLRHLLLKSRSSAKV